MDSMEHRMNCLRLRISMIFHDLFSYFLKNNVVEIVNKIYTLHIHIRGTDCIQACSFGYCKPFCMVDYVIPYSHVFKLRGKNKIGGVFHCTLII